MLFMALWDQWHIVPVGMSGIWYEGLDNAKVQATMEMMKVKDHARALDDLRVMVAAAKVVRNRKANRK